MTSLFTHYQIIATIIYHIITTTMEDEMYEQNTFPKEQAAEEAQREENMQYFREFKRSNVTYGSLVVEIRPFSYIIPPLQYLDMPERTILRHFAPHAYMDFLPLGYSSNTDRTHIPNIYRMLIRDGARFANELLTNPLYADINYVFGKTNPQMAEFAIRHLGFHILREVGIKDFRSSQQILDDAKAAYTTNIATTVDIGFTREEVPAILARMEAFKQRHKDIFADIS